MDPQSENKDLGYRIDGAANTGSKTAIVNEEDQNDEDESDEEQFLCFVKVMDNEKKNFRQVGHVFLKENSKFDLSVLLKKTGLLDDDQEQLSLENLSVFVEPSSNYGLRLASGQTM